MPAGFRRGFAEALAEFNSRSAGIEIPPARASNPPAEPRRGFVDFFGPRQKSGGTPAGLCQPFLTSTEVRRGLTVAQQGSSNAHQGQQDTAGVLPDFCRGPKRSIKPRRGSAGGLLALVGGISMPAERELNSASASAEPRRNPAGIFLTFQTNSCSGSPC